MRWQDEWKRSTKPLRLIKRLKDFQFLARTLNFLHQESTDESEIMRERRFVIVAVVVLVILISECATKSSVKPKGKSHNKKNEIRVLKSKVKHKKNDYKNETKRQFINRPRIRYFGNRPYIWMKPSPLTQRTIVTTHIPRPPLALPYSSRIMRLLANRYPSLYGRQTMPQGLAGYGGMTQGPLFGPGMHTDGFGGTDTPFGDEDSDG